MWTEMQTLLHYNVTLLDQPALRKLVIHENILGKATFSNRQQVWAKMKRRYRLNQHDPVFHYFLESYSTDTSTSQRGLLGYLLLCASDALVQRISQDWLVPRLLRPGSLLRTEEVETYLITLSKERPAIAKWTTDTRLHISQHYLGAVRDFGLAEGKAIKRTLSPQVGSQVLVYAIKLGMLQELKPVEILQSVWFRLLGIELDEAISRMYQLNAEGLIKFRMVGNIAELALVVKEEV